MGEEQRGVDAAFGGRLAESGHRFDREVVQHRIEKRRVLALKQTDPSKIMRQCNGDVRADILQDVACRNLAAWIKR